MRPTDNMNALAAATSAIENRTVQEIADDWVNELVSIAQGDPGRLAAPPRPHSVLRAVRFALSSDNPLVSAGRIADITFVFNTNNVVDYAVLDYSEIQGRAQRVLTGPDAAALWTVLDRHHAPRVCAHCGQSIRPIPVDQVPIDPRTRSVDSAQAYVAAVRAEVGDTVWINADNGRHTCSSASIWHEPNDVPAAQDAAPDEPVAP